METFVGDIILLSIETNVDLVGTNVEILYKKPDSTYGVWEARIDSKDNSKVVYTTVTDDLDIPGIWQLHVRSYSDSKEAHGKIFELNVNKPLISPIKDIE